MLLTYGFVRVFLSINLIKYNKNQILCQKIETINLCSIYKKIKE